ncbi:hypothetical protein GIB67_016187 [Kingdonia uniflora]|uniref:Uncharacterized protein n=1 Tax=Kingdonia uniflora TaxID=39325 RepID=A0A7J7LT52_9MAGN|nr:hypothetical protein GIB67_016187 [Kingdonia uniflora]
MAGICEEEGDKGPRLLLISLPWGTFDKTQKFLSEREKAIEHLTKAVLLDPTSAMGPESFGAETIQSYYIGLKGEETQGHDTSKKAAQISWNKVRTTNSEGGLVLKRLKEWNRAVVLKLTFRIASKEQGIWATWVHTHLLRGKYF